MTTCDTICPRLTAYLDGELADDAGSVVRGHLRECASCRQLARDEASLRDALRMLPPVDPPATLWAGVQTQLAAAEVADARRPGWRRAITRWLPQLRRLAPSLPQLAVAGGLAVTAVVALSVRARDRAPQPVAVIAGTPDRAAAVAQPSPGAAASPAADVTAELRAEPGRVTASYDQVIDELRRLADEARSGWAGERGVAFDATVAALAADVSHAGAASAR
jgi:anti-sigma factor RsiW